MTPVYTVRACRWGDTETHSYIVGVYSTEKFALKAADEEEDWRGGKYQCEVLKWVLNNGSEGDLNFRPQIIKRCGGVISGVKRMKVRDMPVVIIIPFVFAGLIIYVLLLLFAGNRQADRFEKKCYDWYDGKSNR